MTKEEIIEMQEKTARLRRLFWQLLMRGQFKDDEHAKAIFTCYFTLDKVCDLVKRYISQLPLELGETPVTVTLEHKGRKVTLGAKGEVPK